jgi:DNA-binding NarL/FixJ family response regulator
MRQIEKLLIAKYKISHRKAEVAALVSDGLSNAQIANKLEVSEHNVKFHLTGLFRSLRIENRRELTSLVYRLSLRQNAKH